MPRHLLLPLLLALALPVAAAAPPPSLDPDQPIDFRSCHRPLALAPASLTRAAASTVRGERLQKHRGGPLFYRGITAGGQPAAQRRPAHPHRACDSVGPPGQVKVAETNGSRFSGSPRTAPPRRCSRTAEMRSR